MRDTDVPWKELGVIPDEWFRLEGPKLVWSEHAIRKAKVPYVLNDGPENPCIYFLFWQEEIVYVGISRYPMMRFIQHWKKGWQFDSYTAIFGIPQLYIEDFEAFYIHRHKPYFNVKYPILREPLAALVPVG